MEREKISLGVIVPLITPYRMEDILPLMEYVVKGGVSQLLLLGTTGEALKLPGAKRKELIRKAALFSGANAKILVGVTDTRWEETLNLLQYLNDYPAFMPFVAPCVLGGNSGEIIEKILSATEKDIVLYNCPALSEGLSLSIKDIEPYLSEKRILGIKDSSGDFDYFDALLQLKKKSHLKIFYGRERDLDKALERDIDGFVPATGNAAPHLVSELWKKKKEGPWQEWKAIKEEIKAKDPEDYIHGIKEILRERGILTDSRLFTF